LGIVERLLLGFDIIKIREPLQICPEMGRRQGALKTPPPSGLRILRPSERFKNVDAGIFPFEVRPIPTAAAPPMLCRLDCPPSLLRSTGGKEASRDFSGDLRHLPGFFLVTVQ
jgi:hypothetical protein